MPAFPAARGGREREDPEDDGEEDDDRDEEDQDASNDLSDSTSVQRSRRRHLGSSQAEAFLRWTAYSIILVGLSIKIARIVQGGIRGFYASFALC